MFLYKGLKGRHFMMSDWVGFCLGIAVMLGTAAILLVSGPTV